MDACNDSSCDVNDTYYGDYGNVTELLNLCIPKNYDGITAVSYIIICCISLLGNSLLLYGLARFEDLKRVTMLFIFYLAIFDLLFTLTLPFWAADLLHPWIFGEIVCKIMSGAYFVGIYGSLILLTAMTVDRFFAIVVRSQWLTHRRRLYSAKAACAGAWIISVGACLKDALSSKVLGGFCSDEPSDDDKRGYYIQPILYFFFPLSIILFCYSTILLTLMSTSAKQKYRTVLVVLCIVVAFAICWGPYHIMMILMGVYSHAECWLWIRLKQAFLVCRILAYFHCCVNPMLYMLRGRAKRILSSLLFCSPELRRASYHERNTEPSHSNIVKQNSVAVEGVDICTGKQHNAVELKSF